MPMVNYKYNNTLPVCQKTVNQLIRPIATGYNSRYPEAHKKSKVSSSAIQLLFTIRKASWVTFQLPNDFRFRFMCQSPLLRPNPTSITIGFYLESGRNEAQIHESTVIGRGHGWTSKFVARRSLSFYVHFLVT